MPEPDSVPAAWPGQKRVPDSCNVNKTLSVAFSEAFSDFPGIFVFVTMGPSMENKTTARQVCSHQGLLIVLSVPRQLRIQRKTLSQTNKNK